MAKVIDFENRTTPTNTSNKTLDEAKDMGFDAVIIFGFKDNKTHIKGSYIPSTIETIGMIEMAKHHLAQD